MFCLNSVSSKFIACLVFLAEFEAQATLGEAVSAAGEPALHAASRCGLREAATGTLPMLQDVSEKDSKVKMKHSDFSEFTLRSLRLLQSLNSLKRIRRVRGGSSQVVKALLEGKANPLQRNAQGLGPPNFSPAQGFRWIFFLCIY